MPSLMAAPSRTTPPAARRPLAPVADAAPRGQAARLAHVVRRAAVRVLRVRLAGKLVGANALVVAAAAAAVPAVEPGALAWVVGALAAALALSLALVALALRPLHALEATAARVWRGDTEARVPPSPLADPAVARVGHAFNAMLDALGRDRARLRALTADAIRAGRDELGERRELERALRESAAQTLAASVLQLSVARRALDAPAASSGATPVPDDAAAALVLAHRLAADALDELHQLAAGARP